MFEHILVPVDGSRLSLKAVKAGARLAQAFHARMTIYFCAPDFLGHYARESPELREHYSSRRFREAVGRHSQRILDQAAKHAGVEVQTHRDLGTTPYAGITRAAKNLHCDLIVMATHGKRNELGLEPAGETQGVINHTRLPVLVVH